MGLRRSFKLLYLIKSIIKADYEQVAGLMGEMHGLPQKLGQHFTLYPARQFNQYFASLCTESNPEEIPIETILKELGINYNDYKIHAQASIGQVYQVETKDGLLAVKVKYPNIEKRIRKDFRLLKGILWPTKFLPLRNSGLLQILENTKSMLLSECDYIKEAEIQRDFHHLFIEDVDISVPEVVAYNDRAIASRWIEGKALSNFNEPLDQDFIQSYFTFVLKSLKELRMVHTDPHPGNFIINGATNNLKLTVLDFGSIAAFTNEEFKAVSGLLLGNYNNEEELIKDLSTLGVNKEVLEMYRPIIGDLVSILLEPFYYPGDYDFTNWRMQYKLNTLLASRAWDKPLDIPLKLILLFRTIQGLYFYARNNYIVFNWHDVITKYLG